MKLLIDPTGGMAGDMFAAALISAGADEKQMIDAMQLAARKIGNSNIKVLKTHDNACRLSIEIEHHHGHLSGHKAQHHLHHIFDEIGLIEPYSSFGIAALNALVEAEIKAHKENTFLTDHAHHHHHHHGQGEDALLHEAQDILIDITGAAYGLQLLQAPITAGLSSAVSLGGGSITFSHGTLPVPAPATKNIIRKYDIPSTMGPILTELCTPTGAAILSALQSKTVRVEEESLQIKHTGLSRGGKDLDIPPLKIFLTE